MRGVGGYILVSCVHSNTSWHLKLVINYLYIIYFDENCVFHINMYIYSCIYHPYIAVKQVS